MMTLSLHQAERRSGFRPPALPHCFVGPWLSSDPLR